MSEKKDKDIQSPKDTKKVNVTEGEIESVNVPTDSAKRKQGCNRKKCYCVQ